MSPSRKRNLKLYGNLYQRKGAWKELFDRLNEAEEYDDATIRGQRFRTAKAFSTAKKKILDILVASIAHFEYQNQRTTIEIACDLEMSEYAVKLLDRKIQKAQQEEQLEELYRLYQIARDLQRDPVYQYEPPQVELTEEVVVAEMGTHLRLNQSLEAIRTAFRMPYQEQKFRARKFRSELQGTRPLTRRARFIHDKALAGCASLESDVAASIALHRAIVDGFQEGRYEATPIEVMAEHAVLILSLLQGQQTAEAQRYILKMGLIAPDTPREQRVFDSYFILSSIGIADVTHSLSLLEMGVERMEKWQGQMTPRTIVNRRLTAAKVYFVNGEFTKCLQQLQRIEQISSGHWESYAWLVRSLELVATIEMKDWDRFEYAAARARRWASSEELAYPGQMLRTLAQAGQGFSSDFSDHLLHEVLVSIDEVENAKPEAKSRLQVFDFRKWIVAKLSDKSMLETVGFGEDKRQELFSKIV